VRSMADKQIQSRQRRAGAVLVEGLIVACALALFMAACVFAHRLYSAKLSTLREARRLAWMDAMDGCGGALLGALLDGFGALTVLNEADQQGLIDAPEGLTSMGRAPGDPPSISVESGPMLGSTSHTISTRTSVACNEYGDDDTGSLLLNLAGMVREVVPIDF
jgi:hypothetical protein